MDKIKAKRDFNKTDKGPHKMTPTCDICFKTENPVYLKSYQFVIDYNCDDEIRNACIDCQLKNLDEIFNAENINGTLVAKFKNKRALNHALNRVRSKNV